MSQFMVSFVPSGRGKAQCPPNPQYPNGIAITANKGNEPSCKAELPYPAPECGYHLVECALCNVSVGITAAGRPDDPISIEILCKLDGHAAGKEGAQ
jgi:hypothetical protein